MKYGLNILILLGFMQIASAQDVVVRSGFFADSLRVGDQTGFYLAAKYPSNLNLIFPDSAFNFSPFEFVSKQYFPTETTAGKSYDSVIYYLSTFEVEPLQTLALPVFQLNPQDCTVYTSEVDTVLLIELAKNISDTLQAQNLPLKVNIAPEAVPYTFNYPVLIIVVVVLLVITAFVWIVFGKKIKKHFILKRMQKAHRQFLDAYDKQVEALKAAFSSSNAEHALAQWKVYMEQLESRPYTKLTTRETTQLENDAALGKNLHSVDGAIYGHNTSVVEPLEKLKQFADQRFVKKLEEVKHG